MSNIGKFAAVFALLVVIVLAVGASYSGATHIVTVDNESLTMSLPDGTSTVEGDDLAVTFLDNETITNDDSGQTLSEGTDYEWDTSNGTITWLDSGKTSDGANASIDYAYNGHTQETEDLAAVLQQAGFGLSLVMLFMGAMVVLGWLGMTPGGR